MPAPLAEEPETPTFKKPPSFEMSTPHTPERGRPLVFDGLLVVPTLPLFDAACARKA
jgi:hypothetical protein